MKHTLTILLIAFLHTLGHSQLLTWNFSGQPGTQNNQPSATNATGISPGNLLRAAGLSGNAGSNSMNSAGWMESAGDIDDVTEQQSESDYYEFTLPIQAAYTANITTVVLAFQSSGTGPDGVTLRWSVDGYASNLGTLGSGTGTLTANINQMQGPNLTITFRVYGTRAGSGGATAGTGRLNSLAINGTTTPASSPVVLTCPTNTTTTACQTQTAVNAAFTTWLATASGSGGCSGVLTNNNTGAPPACGGSRTVTFTYTSTCAPLTTTCQATFTVPAAPTVTLTCPTNTTTTDCQTQAAVNSAFTTWLATASASGGCSGSLTNNNSGAPPACGGSTTVTFTYTSSCAPTTTTCEATFTVPTSPTVTLTCPMDMTTTNCQTQAAVNSAFSAWLATASASGGCSGSLTNNNSGAPPACGGSTTVTFTYTSSCAPTTTTCEATFTVPTPSTVSLTCPVNASEPTGQTQAAINSAFATWLATASASGGCDGVLTNDNTGAPSAIGGSATVTFTYTSTCAPLTTTCEATFTVEATSPITLTCPTNTTATACQTQVEVDAAFSAWLATAAASGGCDGVLTNDNAGAPLACGGSTTVIFTYTSTCLAPTTTCEATFTVPTPSPVTLTCPTPTTVASCQTQAAVDAQYAAWLATFNGQGGCNLSGSDNGIFPPSNCGEVKTVTFTATSTCAPLTTTCQSTFTVTAPASVVLTCPTNMTTTACQTQAAVNAAFSAWLATASASGGCDGVLTNDNMGAPLACGGSTTVTFTYTSSCAPTTTTCQATFTVPASSTPVLTCPTDLVRPGCSTRSQDSIALQNWFNTASFSGGCGGVISYNGFNGSPPDRCGGTKTLNITYTTNCAAPLTCSANFTIPAPPTVSLTCPVNASQPTGQTQAAINSAFATWLATASASGGCNGSLTNNNTGAPPATGGSVTVTFTYTSNCAPLTSTCQATFTVEASPPVVLTCPTNTTVSPCLTQTELNAQYATWLSTASGTGGCNGVLTNNSTGAPSICTAAGSTTTVTFTYTSTCGQLTTTCEATFGVQAYPNFPGLTNTSSSVACPALATQPTPPTVVDGCGKTVSPVGPTITDVPNPLTCEGMRTYAWTYTDCAGRVNTWSHVYTIERQPFTIATPNGTATVACLANATAPTPPTVMSNCGETLPTPTPTITDSPNPLTCEGTRTYAYAYTDCEGNTATWSHVYTIERQLFTIATPNGTATVACLVNATAPTPPTVMSNCSETLPAPTPTVTDSPNPLTCEGTRTYAYAYTDCEGNTATWSHVYTIERQLFTIATPNGTATVACLANATAPTPPTVMSNCGETLPAPTPTITDSPNPLTCEGTRTYAYAYTDCEGNTATWSHVYTIERQPFTIATPNGTATVACLANATAPTPSTVMSNCGETLPAPTPTVTDSPNPLTCEGTRTYAYVYTDCEGNTATWSFVYTIEQETFTIATPNGTATVACLSNATAPTPPTVTSNCGETLPTPTPTITDSPNPLTCEGTRTYAYAYTDCEGNTATWSFVYTIERQIFTTPANGTATVACLSNATTPTAPTVTNNCGETLPTPTPTITDAPNPLTCEGTRTYAYAYTDCEGNTATWSFVYTIERETFTTPANGTATVACLANATTPTLPTVTSNCGETLTPTGPTITDSPNPLTCEGTRTYAYIYTDCEGNTATWSFVYTIERETFTTPANGTATVACLANATTPTLPTVTSNCGETLTPTGPTITDSPNPLTCEGTRTYAYIYTDCEGNTATWSFVYTIEQETFTITTPNGAATVACLANATPPTPPTVTNNCGETLPTPTPTITDSPNPMTCEGTRTYAYVYTDCEGNTTTWSFVYTIERQPFTIATPNGTATVACLSNATAPTPPTVTSNCGETLPTPTPTITDSPNPLTCEGTRTYAYAYTDCEGNTATWSFVYTIERQIFAISTPNGAATVACPAQAVQPTPPTITSNCGETLTPTGPTVTSVPTSITCEGTRTYAWVYTDCEGNTATWSFVYTIERIPFLISTPPGSATVSCPSAADVTPTPPTVTSNCGEPITPTVTASPANDCEGDRVYTFTYADCEGNSAAWLFTYHVVFQDFVVPTSIVGTVNCPSEIFEPTPPSVLDNCGSAITPVGPEVFTTDNANGCETSRSYSWTYTDCSGTAHGWSQTFLVDYDGDFIAPLNEENHVACLAHAVAPFPQVLFDGCGQQMTVSGPTVAEDISPTGCSGVRTFTFAYSDCAGNTHPWSFTYYINDDQGPLGTCPSGGTVTVDVPNLLCIEDVPCPDDYDFTSKVQELLAAGGYFDVCDGITVNAELESWADLWQCGDADGNGVNTFGRTFYFRISDHCGNEYPSLCSVTYSGVCQPLATFPQTAWGIAGGTPGTSVGTTDLQLIGSLIPVNSPIVVGGSHRSLTVSDAQCVVDLLPGGSAPGPLANCHQTNCTGCNPMGIGGMKNPLAANAVALVLNVRYNVQQNELTLAAVRSQNLGCMPVSQNITSCASTVPGDCRLRIFEQSGAEHQFPYTLGGLLDLANLFLDGNLQLSIGQQQQYAAAINKALADANARWENGQVAVACTQNAGSSPLVEDNTGSKALPNATNTNISTGFALVPNPASGGVTLTLELDAPAEVTLELYNQLGQRVLSRDLGTASTVAERIDLSSLHGGVYTAVLTAGQQRMAQKLVVSRD